MSMSASQFYPFSSTNMSQLLISGPSITMTDRQFDPTMFEIILLSVRKGAK